ncbi:hypothetical protein CB0940_04224 [Cercospora beticola]|uniref:Uncharacterized protein n=1 Tax=Cercospora beticola TaxID=122368 RepID=A0A2G5HMV2_CERBT|nr:hypothetical protein CB0940_04224 [Cercospora beticola]PIA93828.1 hypothetical protein CB0940_04224 [Cercospora beticola]WPB01444.1 hypothetical protein RHO25_006070 [Cercospora beticola]
MAQPKAVPKTGFLDLPRELRDDIYTNIISNVTSNEEPEVRDSNIQNPDFLNICAAHPQIATEIRERDQATRRHIKFHLRARSAPWIPPLAAYKRLQLISIEFKTYEVKQDWKGDADRCPWEISEVARHLAEVVKWINTHSGSASLPRRLSVKFEDGGDGDISFYDEFWDPGSFWHSERGRRLAQMETDSYSSLPIVERLLEPLRKIQPDVFREARIWEIDDVMSEEQSQDCGIWNEVYDSLWASDYFYELQRWICGHEREGEKEKIKWVELLEKYW